MSPRSWRDLALRSGFPAERLTQGERELLNLLDRLLVRGEGWRRGRDRLAGHRRRVEIHPERLAAQTATRKSRTISSRTLSRALARLVRLGLVEAQRRRGCRALIAPTWWRHPSTPETVDPLTVWTRARERLHPPEVADLCPTCVRPVSDHPVRTEPDLTSMSENGLPESKVGQTVERCNVVTSGRNYREEPGPISPTLDTDQRRTLPRRPPPRGRPQRKPLPIPDPDLRGEASELLERVRGSDGWDRAEGLLRWALTRGDPMAVIGRFSATVAGWESGRVASPKAYFRELLRSELGIETGQARPIADRRSPARGPQGIGELPYGIGPQRAPDPGRSVDREPFNIALKRFALDRPDRQALILEALRAADRGRLEELTLRWAGEDVLNRPPTRAQNRPAEAPGEPFCATCPQGG